MTPKHAGLRLILLALPFLAFGLLWALRPPQADVLGEGALAVTRALGVGLVLLGVAAVAFGVFLLRQPQDKIL